MEYQGQIAQRQKSRDRVPKICNGLAAFLLVCVIVLGGVGVGIPMWATLSPRRSSDGIHRKVNVGMFHLSLVSTYPSCITVSPVCHVTPAFNIGNGNNVSNVMDVDINWCGLMCNKKNQLEVAAMIGTTDYLSRLQDRIRNATQDEVIADMTIPVRCRNFIAPRGMIIAGLATAAFALILVVIGMKYPTIGWLATCLCVCAFVVQLIGLILASVYSVRPCDRMNESWEYTLGASFILVVISTALLLGVCILNTCAIIAYFVSRGVQAASNMRGAVMGGHQHGDAEMGIGASTSTDPLHRAHGGHDSHMMGGHSPSHPNQYVSIGGVPHLGARGGRGDINMQMPSHVSGSVGIPIPITTPSGMNMPNVPFGSAMSGLHGPGAIVTHTTHMEEHTITQQTTDA